MMRRKLKRPAMPGAGRPPLLNARRNTIRVRVTDDELERFRADATSEGHATISDWGRAAFELAHARGASR